MSYDHMGRRREKNAQRFFYDGYLQVVDNGGNFYTWDCTERVATRPLAWSQVDSVAYYTHDGNKNVSEVVAADGTFAAHYEYAPFGAVIAQRGTSTASNSWRFSSEYVEDDTATVYYNYRHYDSTIGRWLKMDGIQELGGINIYVILFNNAISNVDRLGNDVCCKCSYLNLLLPGESTGETRIGKHKCDRLNVNKAISISLTSQCMPKFLDFPKSCYAKECKSEIFYICKAYRSTKNPKLVGYLWHYVSSSVGDCK
jgi:RHS repeat-associated protein